MMEEIPFAFEFDYRMVGSPSDDRLKDYTFVSEWSVRVIANGIA